MATSERAESGAGGFGERGGPSLGFDASDAASVAAAAQRFRADFERVRAEVARAVVGHEASVRLVILTLFSGGHCLLEGVPGIGKTLLVRSLARAVDLSFGRVQFTPDLMPADITGTTVVQEAGAETGRVERRFVFQRGPLFHEIVLADEVNRATPKTQSALLEAMAEGSVTVAGVTHALPRPFFVLATQNPIEQEGTYPLPEAQLDRFAYKVLVGTSSRAELAEVLGRTTGASVAGPERVLERGTLLSHQALVRLVPAAGPIVDYAVRLTLATHPKDGTGGGEFATPMVNKYVRVGASPRAAQALLLGAKCLALLDGRAAVSIDDLRALAAPALRHRLVLNFEAAAEGVTADAVVQNLVETLPRDAA